MSMNQTCFDHTCYQNYGTIIGLTLCGTSILPDSWKTEIRKKKEEKSSADELSHLLPYLETSRLFCVLMRTKFSCSCFWQISSFTHQLRSKSPLQITTKCFAHSQGTHQALLHVPMADTRIFSILQML